MDNIFRTISTLCDDNLIPYYNKLIDTINSCPETDETRILAEETEAIRMMIESLKSQMAEIDMVIAKKYNL